MVFFWRRIFRFGWIDNQETVSDFTDWLHGFSDPAASQVVCSLLSKFFATVAFDTVYSFTTELFPTHCRTFTIGLCSTFGRLGSIVAPIIADLGRTQNRAIPFIVFSIFNFVSGFLCLTLPETNNLALPATIKEAKNLNRHALPCFRCVKDN